MLYLLWKSQKRRNILPWCYEPKHEGVWVHNIICMLTQLADFHRLRLNNFRFQRY